MTDLKEATCVLPNKLIMRLIIVILLLSATLTGQSKDRKTKNQLFAEDEKVLLAGSGYSFTEGPSVAADGSVYFTDQPNNKIDIWHEDGSISTFTRNSDRANGTFFNSKGELVACADLHNRLVSYAADKQIKTLAENYNGKHFNGPNDLWIAPGGGIYFTDPYYHRDYWMNGHTELQDTRGVYYLDPKGKVTRVVDDFKQPNGLIGTSDGKTLYVSDINDRKIWKYNVNADGSLSNKTYFAPEGSDGMTIDKKGNVYLTNRFVSVYNPKGENIAKIAVPEQPSNLCFGGKKRNILFITARTSVYILKMKVRGY
jgi:gluconolactonase